MYLVYFAQSLKNNKIYVGRTLKDPEARIIEHNQNSTTWTRQNGPFKLIYYEKYYCKKDAISREKFYKSGFGKQIKYAIVGSVSAIGRSALGRG